MAQHVCSRHRGQQLRRSQYGNPQSESRCRRNHQHQQMARHESMNRNYAHQHRNHGDMCRSRVQRRPSMGYTDNRERHSSHQHHHQRCRHYQDHQEHGHGRHRRDDSDYDSDGGCQNHLPRIDGGYTSRKSTRRSSSRSKRSKSQIAPMNYGVPGCQGCHSPGILQPMQQPGPQMQPMMQQAPQPTQGQWQMMPQQQMPGQGMVPCQPQGDLQQQQQQQAQKPPPPELEAMRKNVFKGIKEFSKSLRKQQWLGDVDYVRSSRKVNHGHKPESLEKHRKKSKRRDWAQQY